ncbi:MULTISPECIES: helix-hairpin-helix domain-containing protein [unclassified Bifidobacterium]|uniref:ComEA family DNA-binding protein n=1 Tax=unclassified Bifidobacterium TaxID=2608897 RepID=UPI002158B08A|nr:MULTISPECIES: helix-hairpin-helix domain-containing protein [unclassified Bifidobacterium]
MPDRVAADRSSSDDSSHSSGFDDVAAAGTMARDRKPLGELIGVRLSDSVAEGARRNRDKPRVVFTVNHALAVILILIAALGASLALLVQQSMNLTALSSGIGTSSDIGTAQLDGGEADADGDTRTGDTDPGDDAPSNPGLDTGSAAGDDSEADPLPQADDHRIDLNTATSEQLQTINGIGPTMAERILAHRESIGRFSSVDQLLDVDGIGSKTLEKMRGQVTVR